MLLVRYVNNRLSILAEGYVLISHCSKFKSDFLKLLITNLCEVLRFLKCLEMHII